MSDFEQFFQRTEPKRGAFLSRYFAFFSEEVVRHWAKCDQAPYRDLGRPTLWSGNNNYHTLDFTLQSRRDQKSYVGELKCELEYENYKYLRLTNLSQLTHHLGGAAFKKFLFLAEDPDALVVKLAARNHKVDGAILVWGDVSDAGRVAAIERYGFADVLAVSDMLQDLSIWRPVAWEEFVGTRKRWTTELFDFLAYPLD
jgi:hypothetical protein